ncbi:MAG: 50S ribosomal protein L18 [Patescibacteria group bacterium]
MANVTHYENSKQRRKARVRSKLFGTGDRPRLSVFRSNKHIYAQLIDDVQGNTLVAASDFDLDDVSGNNVDISRKVGKVLGERGLKEGIEKVVFDRGGHKYHGAVAAFAEGAREAGLEF